MIGRAKLRHHRNQSNQELKSILIWSLAFSRASSRLPLFTLSSHRLMMMFWLVAVITENYDWIVLSGFACTLLWRPPELSLLFVSYFFHLENWLVSSDTVRMQRSGGAYRRIALNITFHFSKFLKSWRLVSNNCNFFPPRNFPEWVQTEHQGDWREAECVQRRRWRPTYGSGDRFEKVTKC